MEKLLKMKLKLILFCFLIVISNRVTAENHYFRNYLNRMENNAQTVLCIQQDRQGYIWYSTGHGIFRFDGNHSYLLNQLFPALGTKCMEYQPYIFIDSRNRMFLPAGDVLDLTSHKYYKKLCRSYNGRMIVEDICHNLWIPLMNNCLKKENLATGRSTVYKNMNSIFADATDNNYYYLSNDGWLRRISIHGKAIYQNIIKIHTKSNINIMCCVNDNEILVGTEKELLLINTKKRKQETIKNDVFVRSIVLKSKRECWIATETGMLVYRTGVGKLEYIVKNTLNPNALQDNSCYSLLTDRRGGIWVGHYFKGLSYSPTRVCNFEVTQSQRTDANMKGNVVREFCKDSNGNIWIGTEDSGLNCFNTKTRHFTNFSPSQASCYITTTNVHALATIDGKLWFGSFDKGIGIMDVVNKKMCGKYREGDGSGLNCNYIFTIFKTARYGTLIGTQKGILQYNETNEKFTAFKRAGDYGKCINMFVDSKGRLWACRSQKIECIYPNGCKIVYSMLNGNDANSIMEDSRGQIWLTAHRGLGIYDEKQKRFVAQNFTQDLSSCQTYRILEDSNKGLWISSDNGLIYYNLISEKSKVFKETEGLPTKNFNTSSSMRDNDGKMYFGTFDGYISFYPSSLDLNLPIPPLVFTRFIASGTNQSDTVYYANIDKIPSFGHQQNTITANFASLQYETAENLNFMYQIKGLEQKWHILYGYNTITYPSLPPGHYTLRLRSTDVKGNWADNEIELPFIIRPPFYLSRFAIFIYIICILYVAYYTNNLVRRRTRIRHEQQINELNREKEKELFNTKINFFTTMVHEIRTPLTLIKAPLEKALNMERDEEITQNLKLAEMNADRLNSLCTQLLNFRKMESSQLQLNFVITDVTQLLGNITYRFKGMLVSKGLSYSDNLTDVHIDAAVDKEAFTKIISNLMNNACKYSSTFISLEISQDDINFYVRISNDGELITSKEKENVFSMFYRGATGKNKVGAGIGLSFCRSLAEMHNGTLIIDDNNQDINTFVLTLPIHQKMEFREAKADDGDITDTKVENAIQGISSGEQMNILIVDDEPEMRSFIKRSLPTRFKAFCAANGEQAMAILEKNDIDLVVTDVMMPKMDGCELCREICNRMEWSSIPVIMLTAKVNVEARLEGFAAGAEEYIDKPFSMDYLIARIEGLIDKADKRKQQVRKGNAEASLIDNIEKRSDRAFIERFVAIVDEEMKNPDLNVEMVRNKMVVSYTVLFRRCKQLLQVSPVEYIRNVRMKKAAELLLIDNIRISDVAYEVGFSSAIYFTSCFTKQYGMSPTKYIETHKQK